MKSIIIALVLFGYLGVVQCSDYCLSSLCPDSTNIGCNNDGAFAEDCPNGTTVMVTMTDELKQVILHNHNTKRNTLAAGNLTGFDPAITMATMVWDDELAEQASFNVKQCVLKHDACRNTETYHWSGQNLAKTWWSGGAPTDIEIISPQIDAWWSEYKDTTMSDIESFPSTSTSVIGHFTVMTAYQNIAVGCSAIRFPDPGLSNWDSLTLACNYARTNIVGVHMYIPGTTASDCTTGTNPDYPALCSVNEPYDVNEVF